MLWIMSSLLEEFMLDRGHCFRNHIIILEQNV